MKFASSIGATRRLLSSSSTGSLTSISSPVTLRPGRRRMAEDLELRLHSLLQTVTILHQNILVNQAFLSDNKKVVSQIANTLNRVDKSLNERTTQLTTMTLSLNSSSNSDDDSITPEETSRRLREEYQRLENMLLAKKPVLGGFLNEYERASQLDAKDDDASMIYSKPKNNKLKNELSSKEDNTTPPPASAIDNDDVGSLQHIKINWDHLPTNFTSLSPDKTYVLRFDGGSRGNPGIAGAGMVLYNGEDGTEVWSGYHYLGDKYTNNEAEYRGLITGLQCARTLGVQNIVVQGDSQLILRQIVGEYKVKSVTLKAYYDEAVSLIPAFKSFQTSHIERARNARADELANLAMDFQSSVGFEMMAKE